MESKIEADEIPLVLAQPVRQTPGSRKENNVDRNCDKNNSHAAFGTKSLSVSE